MPSGNGKLGTFAGVFTPSILTILGIILFLRLGYVVGNVGLGRTLAIIAIANLISVLTSLSVAAIATNLKVRAGGDYYVISRTLGISFGGAIGLVLFLAQSVSVGFYCVGFAEVAAAYFPEAGPWLVRGVAASAVAALFVLAWLGADWATRFQYVVMALIGAALASVAIGGIDLWSTFRLLGNFPAPEVPVPFWVAFAVFFPAVTGFTQGISMSGDLADPARSIPLGTLTAVGISILIYVGTAVLFAAALPGATLAADYGAMGIVSDWAPLVTLGAFAATLSSALASFLGGPRILQALAADRIFPVLVPFAAGSGPGNNPRRAVLLSLAIALGVVLLGNLNLVASIVSMFFLLSYGLLNYATFFEARTESASFRPSFRWHHRSLSLAGALLCLGAMLAIDIASGLVAASIIFAIYHYLRMRGDPARWADSRRAHHLHRARESLIAAAREPEHPRYWRPQLLVLSDSRERRARLLRFASWIEGSIGLTTIARILPGWGEGMVKQRTAAIDELTEEIREIGVDAFPMVVVAPDVDGAAACIVQSAGVGPVRVNTVLTNWHEAPGFVRTLGSTRFGRNLRTAFRLGCNLLVLGAEPAEWRRVQELAPDERRIDVWWTEGPTGEMMLLLAHLMTRSEIWEEARIRLLAVSSADPDRLREQLDKRLGEFRISADVEIVDGFSTGRIVEISRESAIVFLPFSVQGGSFSVPLAADLDGLVDQLPIFVLAMAAQDVDLRADPDEGEISEAAARRDRLEDAEALVGKLEREHDSAQVALEAEHEKLARMNDAAMEDDGDGETVQRRAVSEAEEALRKAKRALDRVRRVRDRLCAAVSEREE